MQKNILITGVSGFIGEALNRDFEFMPSVNLCIGLRKIAEGNKEYYA